MRHHRSRNALALTFALAVGMAGCASGGGGSSRPEGATSDRIVRAELVTFGQLDARQSIERLRARWLQGRLGSAGQRPILYVDGARRGDAITELQRIRTDQIEQIEYMSPNDATTRFGTGHSGGAIMVTSIR